MKKICIFCLKEFEIIPRQGGMNRKACYNCVPDNLTKSDRLKLERKLFYKIINELKLQRGCDICGYNKCPTALLWHHVGDNKNFNPSDIIKQGTISSLEKYREEVKNCILVCANCHREIHWKLNNE